MTPNHVLTSGNVAADFSIEELEPRLERQMLGFGIDPRIISESLTCGDGWCIYELDITYIGIFFDDGSSLEIL
jgi:hypothetical protein